MSLFKIIEIIGAISSISAGLVAYINWQGDEKVKTVIATIAGIILAVFTVFTHRANTSKRDTYCKIDILSDKLTVMPEPIALMDAPKKNRNVYKINYPRHFKNLPNVSAECFGSGTKLLIFDEKIDSFKIKVKRPIFRLTKKIKIRWVAKGQFVD